MRFYTNPHQFDCGIDLHTRSIYVCILSDDGETLLHRTMKAAPEPFLSRPLLPTVRVSSARSNACSPGMGSPIAALNRKSPVSWATPSP